LDPHAPETIFDEFDTLIVNASNVDGSGREPYRGAVAIKGDRVAAVGSVRGAVNYGLDVRGVIREGCYADVVLMDLPNLRVVGTPLEPRQPPKGIEYVFVNGEAVVRDAR